MWEGRFGAPTLVHDGAARRLGNTAAAACRIATQAITPTRHDASACCRSDLQIAMAPSGAQATPPPLRAGSRRKQRSYKGRMPAHVVGAIFISRWRRQAPRQYHRRCAPDRDASDRSYKSRMPAHVVGAISRSRWCRQAPRQYHRRCAPDREEIRCVEPFSPTIARCRHHCCGSDGSALRRQIAMAPSGAQAIPPPLRVGSRRKRSLLQGHNASACCRSGIHIAMAPSGAQATHRRYAPDREEIFAPTG